MRKINIIFGGLNYPIKVLKKYKKVYNGKTIVVPFTLSCMLMGTKYSHYNKLNDECNNYDLIHLHVLSGSGHYVSRFLDVYPNNKKKIISQIYDNPTSIIGLPEALNKIYNIPIFTTKPFINILFQDCINSSDTFASKPFLKYIPTGIVRSSNDIISPDNYIDIDNILKNWGKYDYCGDVKILDTDSKHLESYKDYPEKYIDFCNSIKLISKY